MEMKRQIFISYSRKDDEIVNFLKNDLYDYPTFLDRKILPGDDWWKKICIKIEDSDIILFVDTLESNRSIFCKAELMYAISLKKNIFPIRMPEARHPLLQPLEENNINFYVYDIFDNGRKSKICKQINFMDFSQQVQIPTQHPINPAHEINQRIYDLKQLINNENSTAGQQISFADDIVKYLDSFATEVKTYYSTRLQEVLTLPNLTGAAKQRFSEIINNNLALQPSLIPRISAWPDGQINDVTNIASDIISKQIIPILGAGLTPELYFKQFAIDIVDLFMPPARQMSNLEKHQERVKIMNEVVGLPCSGCHFYIEERPVSHENLLGCPMLQGLPSISDESPLYQEQQLAIAIKNIRQLSEFFNYYYKPCVTYNRLRILTKKTFEARNGFTYDTSDVYKFFKDLQSGNSRPFDLLITTNFIESTAFSSGNTEYSFQASWEAREDPQDKTITEEKIILIDSSGKTVDPNSIVIGPETGNTSNNEIVINLYGTHKFSQLKPTDSPNTRSKITPILSKSHFNMLLTKLNSCWKLAKAIRSRSLLLIGFSKNDFEIQQVIRHLAIESDPSGKQQVETIYFVYQQTPFDSNIDTQSHSHKLKELNTKAWETIANKIIFIPVTSLKEFIQQFNTLVEEIEAEARMN
jgi:hypothetical protein